MKKLTMSSNVNGSDDIFDFESVSDDDQDTGFNFQYEAPEELYSFNPVDDGEPVEAQTVNGRRVPNISFPTHNNTMKVPLGNPLYCKRLQSWYLGKVAGNVKSSGDDGDFGFGADRTALVYQNTVFNSEMDSESSDSSESESAEEDEAEARPRSPRAVTVNSSVSSAIVCNTTLPSLVFDSEFESGNCDKVYRVYGRPNPPIVVENRTLVHQEYDVTVRKDIYTAGSSQWFFFSADSASVTPESMAALSGQSARTPLTVRFNIVNMLKKDSLYNYGMAAAVYSTKQAEAPEHRAVGWHHAGDYVCYYKNGRTISKKKKKSSRRRALYTATFTYTFQHPGDKVYFAYCFPYTYTQLQEFIVKLESDKDIKLFLRRQKLCETLAGNRCDMLTVSEPVAGGPEAVLVVRPAIVVSARVHPGETNSSYAMQGFLEFITSQDPEALLLRKMFVFKIVPMLNPDGVIHGNNRCNLAGTDLNRRYLEAHEFFHPTIRALKALLLQMQETRGVLMFIDLHGHSKKKNSFVYGCDFTLQSDRYMAALPKYSRADYEARRIYPKIFPKLLCTLSNAHGHSSGVAEDHQLDQGYFSWRDCCFKVQKSKAGCGRIVVWRKCLVEAAYTVELSFCSNGNNSESKLVKQFFSVSGQSSSGNSNGAKLSVDLQDLVSEINAINDSNLSVINRADERGRQSRASSTASASSRSGACSPRPGQGEPSDASSPEYVVHQMHKLFHSHYSYKNRAEMHQASYHYSTVDFKTIGQHIGLALSKFCNLNEANVTKEMNRLRFLASLKQQSKSDQPQAASASVPSSAAVSRRNSLTEISHSLMNPTAAAEEEPEPLLPSRRAGHKVFEESTNALTRSLSPLKREKSSKTIPTSSERSPRQDSSDNNEDAGGEEQEQEQEQVAAKPKRKAKKGRRRSSVAGSDVAAAAGGDAPKKGGKAKRRKSTYSSTGAEYATSIVDLVGGNMLDVPLTKPTVFALDTLYAEFDRLSGKSRSEGLPLRLQTELRLRQTLPPDSDKESKGDKEKISEKLKELIGEPSDSEPDDAGSAGSDSEPSVDNLPLYDIVQKKQKKMKSTGRPNIFARYKITKKWIKKELKVEQTSKEAEAPKAEERAPRKDIRDGIPTPVMYGMSRGSLLNKNSASKYPPLARQESTRERSSSSVSNGSSSSVQLPAAVVGVEKTSNLPMRTMQLDLSSQFGAMTMSSAMEAAHAQSISTGASANPLSTSSSRGNGLFRQSSGKLVTGRTTASPERERELDTSSRNVPLERHGGGGGSGGGGSGGDRTLAAERCNERPSSSGGGGGRGLGTSSPPRAGGNGRNAPVNTRHVTANNSPNNIANRHRLSAANRGGSALGSKLLTIGSSSQRTVSGAGSATNNNLQFLAQKAQFQSEQDKRAMQDKQERVDGSVVTSPISRNRKVSVTVSTVVRDTTNSPSPGGFSNVFASKLVGGGSREPTPDMESFASLPSPCRSAAHTPPTSLLSAAPGVGGGTSSSGRSMMSPTRSPGVGFGAIAVGSQNPNINMTPLPSTSSSDPLNSFSPHNNPGGYSSIGAFPSKLYSSYVPAPAASAGAADNRAYVTSLPIVVDNNGSMSTPPIGGLKKRISDNKLTV